MILDVLDVLISADREVLLKINGCHSAVGDVFFSFITNRLVWIPAYFALAYYLFRQHRPYFLKIVFIGLLMITFTDQVTSSLIKPWVQRLRPCHDPAVAALLHLVDGKCGGTYGFVSSHAANTFALATFISSLFSFRWFWLTIAIVSWAVMVSLSRVYLGVHYPGDILGGALVGVSAGWLAGYCVRRFVFVTSDK